MSVQRTSADIDLENAYDRILLFCGAVLDLVSHEEAQAVVAEIERTDAFMPLFDPTGYMKIRKTLPSHQALAKAFLDFRAAVAGIVDKEVT